MHSSLVARKIALSALVVLALFVGAMFIATSRSSASQSQCSDGTICIWEGRNFDGNFSWFSPGDTGCHPHPGNPQIRSWWNRTGKEPTMGRVGNLGHFPGWLGEGYLDAPICWT
jgi:hypothetical protein